MQKLAVVEVHYQRLAAAGSHPEGELFQVGRAKRLPPLFGPAVGVALVDEVVELGEQAARALGEAVEINLGVQRRQMLEPAQDDGRRPARVHRRQMLGDVVVPAPQVVRSHAVQPPRARRQVDADPARAVGVEALVHPFHVRQQLGGVGVAQTGVQPSEQRRSRAKLGVALRRRRDASAASCAARHYRTLPSRRRSPATPANMRSKNSVSTALDPGMAEPPFI